MLNLDETLWKANIWLIRGGHTNIRFIINAVQRLYKKLHYFRKCCFLNNHITDDAEKKIWIHNKKNT